MKNAKNMRKYLEAPISKILSPQNGTILVIVLFLLLVMAMLTLTLFRIAFFETKMSTNFAAKAATYNAANNKLFQYESKLLEGIKVSAATLIADDPCGTQVYRVEAEATKNSARTKIQSTFAVVAPKPHCDPKLKITPGRQSWVIIND